MPRFSRSLREVGFHGRQSLRILIFSPRQDREGHEFHSCHKARQKPPGFSLKGLLNVSKLRCDFRQFSMERLLRFLVALNQDVQIVVKPHHDRKNSPALQVF